jgi:hypothetical protein
MNHKVIGFCSLVSGLLGIVIGLSVAEMSRNEFESSLYRNLHLKLAVVGACAGALVGAGQEAVRELKSQRDHEWQDER